MRWAWGKLPFTATADVSSFTCLSVFLFFFQLKYMLVSGIQPSDSAIHTHISFFIFFIIMAYYKVMNIVPGAVK